MLGGQRAEVQLSPGDQGDPGVLEGVWVGRQLERDQTARGLRP